MNQNEQETNLIVENTQVEVMGIDYTQVIKALLASGAKRYNNLKVKSCSVTELERYARVVFTIDHYIPAFVQDSDGQYIDGQDDRIMTSNFSLAGVLKNHEDISLLANGVGNIEKCHKIPIIFSGALLDIIQVRYSANTPVSNPFSTHADADEKTYDHDIVVNYVVNIQLGKSGQVVVNNILAQTAASFID